MAPSMISSTVSHSTPSHSFASNLSEQLSQRSELERSELGESGTQTDSAGDKPGFLMRPSPKARSLSDASKPSTSLSPIGGEERPSSKDDSALPSAPQTPRRTPANGPPINLQALPPKVSTPASSSSRTPLSPKLDPSHIYSGSPGSVLPRRSRGLDFSRACTNLHHSILAESSPDSSPTVGGRGVAIPQRRGSHGSTSVPPFSTSNPADRNTISSSMSSVNMMESDTSSSEEDDEPMLGDRDDIIMNTPQAKKLGPGFNAFGGGNVPSPGTDWMGNYSQAAASLLSFQRARFRKGRSRHSSSSASGNSSKQSPAPLSPPVMKSIENGNGNGNGYFGHRNGGPSRRESLSMGTRDLRLSDMSDDGENRGPRGHSPTAAKTEGSGPLGVIRRAVTRRGSLLPKTKTFARIRAALMEETAPIDSDAKREAEVIRQVRETEPDMPQTSPVLSSFSSPNAFVPPGLGEHDEVAERPATSLPDEPSFSDQANRNSGGPEFWNSFDERYRTPPPPPRPHAASSVSEEDITMDMTPSNTAEFVKPGERPASRASTPLPSQSGVISELRRKRRREDDFDPNLFKRRAVSPSMSAQSSPVMPNSPAVTDQGPNIWGPPKSNIGPLFNDRPETAPRNIPTTPHSGTLKRVGMQGMNEASDGFMNMSIE